MQTDRHNIQRQNFIMQESYPPFSLFDDSWQEKCLAFRAAREEINKRVIADTRKGTLPNLYVAGRWIADVYYMSEKEQRELLAKVTQKTQNAQRGKLKDILLINYREAE